MVGMGNERQVMWRRERGKGWTGGILDCAGDEARSDHSVGFHSFC